MHLLSSLTGSDFLLHPSTFCSIIPSSTFTSCLHHILSLLFFFFSWSPPSQSCSPPPPIHRSHSGGLNGRFPGLLPPLLSQVELMFPGFCTILFVGLRPHFPEVQLEFTSFKKKMKVNIEKMFHILLSPLMDSLGTEFQVEFNVPRDLEGTGRAAPCSLALLLRD